MTTLCRIPVLSALVLTALACDGTIVSDAGIVDAGDGVMDASLPIDAGTDDAGVIDTGVDDGGGLDGGGGDGGAVSFGAIGGPCGVLDTELISSEAFMFRNSIELPPTGIEATALTVGAQRILEEPNAGGSSRYSEALAYEVLAQCERAVLVATENEVAYMSMNPPARTDFVALFESSRIGVGVTRAFAFAGVCNPSGPLSATRAEELLRDKLTDVADSTAAVVDSERWRKQIIVVFVDDMAIAATVEAAWNALPPTTRGDTVLYIVSTSGGDNQVYFEDRCSP